MGGWVTYGLGSECDNLPGFIVLESGLIPPGGLDLFGSGFLPATYQGTLFHQGEHPIADLEPREATPALQQGKLNLLRKLNKGVLERFGPVSEIEATIANYELAFRMQSAVPELVDLKGESEATRKLTGSIRRTPKSSAASACWRGAWWSAACASSSCSRHTGSVWTAGTSTATSSRDIAPMPRRWTSPSRRCSKI